MRVFLDTNVLIRAFTARGLSAELFQYLLAEHEILTGEVDLVELRRVLVDGFGAAPRQVALVEALLTAQTIVPKPEAPADLQIRDPDDAWVLASALAGDAEMLVTGDKDLLAVAGRSSLPILTPREAWERLRKDPGIKAWGTRAPDEPDTRPGTTEGARSRRCRASRPGADIGKWVRCSHPLTTGSLRRTRGGSSCFLIIAWKVRRSRNHQVAYCLDSAIHIRGHIAAQNGHATQRVSLGAPTGPMHST